jgi:hypothetical protein
MSGFILVASDSSPSGRRAFVSDEGASVWLYLTDPDGHSIAVDCWLFNTVVAPNDLGGFPDRDRPPPATAAFAKLGSERRTPHPDQVTISWSADGDAACAHVDGALMGFLDARERRSQSVNLVQDGPFGAPLDRKLFAARFNTSRQD